MINIYCTTGAGNNHHSIHVPRRETNISQLTSKSYNVGKKCPKMHTIIFLIKYNRLWIIVCVFWHFCLVPTSVYSSWLVCSEWSILTGRSTCEYYEKGIINVHDTVKYIQPIYCIINHKSKSMIILIWYFKLNSFNLIWNKRGALNPLFVHLLVKLMEIFFFKQSFPEQ